MTKHSYQCRDFHCRKNDPLHSAQDILAEIKLWREMWFCDGEHADDAEANHPTYPLWSAMLDCYYKLKWAIASFERKQAGVPEERERE